jgi:RimJ/RimL family protein N-acetyltransferase
LGGKRVQLVPHRAGLVTDEQVAWLNDPEIVRWSEQRHQIHTLTSQHNYLNSFEGTSNLIWLVQAWINDRPPLRSRSLVDIGTITATIDRPNKYAELGILIGNKDVRGQGLGKEAWSLVMDYLFKVVGVQQIGCGCMGSNLPMVKLATQCGMDPVAILPARFYARDIQERIAAIFFSKSAP